MKLIIGLGNPGAEYAGSHHNFGWSALEKLASELNLKWHEKPKFQSFIAETNIDGEKILLVRPTTFYNLSGEAVRKLRDFYNLANDNILVIHDEMALPIGTIRVRLSGSDAGNNGIKSLIQHIGPNFARIRIGSRTAPTDNGDTRPTGDHKNHVLSRPNKENQAKIDGLYPQLSMFIQQFIKGNLVETTHSS